ncbi:IS630 family transposase [Streptomyces sp. NPDC020799]|uniref:IS630 family transposase n=1 Tax=Streptomyces sp. NPDC020799 TaxID=3365091 RepID=UPI00379B12CA
MAESGDLRRVASAGRGVVRLRVVAALESGQVKGYRQAAEVFKAAERSVGTWWRAYQAGGREALAVRRAGRPGPLEKIGPEDRAVLFQAMADCTPEELLIGGPLWTRPLVAGLVRMVTGMVMTERGVGKWLRRHGFSPQRPDRRSCHQDQAEVDAWLKEEYPVISARAKTEKAVVAWADQCGLRSDTASRGRSWAPRGQTPAVRVSGRWFKVNIMSAIASRGTLYFTVFTEKSTAKTFTTFLDRLARQIGRKVHVIADRHPVHRSKTVRAWLEANSERIELHLMPGCSPGLNPGELLNADIKRHVHAARARSADGLAHETRCFLHRRQHQPHIVRGYFHARHVRYTLQ